MLLCDLNWNTPWQQSNVWSSSANAGHLKVLEKFD